jgi:hypothetical protein
MTWTIGFRPLERAIYGGLAAIRPTAQCLGGGPFVMRRAALLLPSATTRMWEMPGSGRQCRISGTSRFRGIPHCRELRPLCNDALTTFYLRNRAQGFPARDNCYSSASAGRNEPVYINCLLVSGPPSAKLILGLLRALSSDRGAYKKETRETDLEATIGRLNTQ